MKICQLVASRGYGGLEKHFIELCNGQAAQGHDVVAIGHASFAKHLSPEVKHIALDLTKNRRNPVLLCKLAATLRAEKPDIVHAQANKAAGMLTAIRHWVPGCTIGTIHNRKKSSSMFTNMQAVIGVSNGVLKSVHHSSAHAVYNGTKLHTGSVCTRAELDQRFDLNPALPLTLAVGRLVPTKAFDLLIRAWKPEFGQVVIVGDGPEEDSLRQLIGEHKLEKHVILGGFNADVRAMMPAADLLVFSSHREGFSYVLIESLLANLPVLSTRVPGAEEILPPEQIVEPNDADALQAALNTCLSKPAELLTRMNPVFDWAQENLTLDMMVGETLRVYEQALQARQQ